MRLFELFPEADDNADDAKPDDSGEMMQQLRQSALDLITPILGQNVPFVTVQQVIDGLSAARFGVVITPGLVMDILNPDQVKAVSKIEGDRIYLNKPGVDTNNREVDQRQQVQDKKHTSDMAIKQINQNLKK